MKAKRVQTNEMDVPDDLVRTAIAGLDSPTDYRECLPAVTLRTVPLDTGLQAATDNTDNFLIVFVPLFLVVIAIAAAFLK